MKIKAQTLKGFRDFLPEEAKKRQYVINVLKKTFESYGFDPLETPSLEYAEILEGKYGDEGDLLMYKFVDRGGRKVAMRYDQTVPLARVVAQYKNSLPMPFKRYQIQNVWRAENTQKGRFREFLQCDFDIVGTDSLLADLEIIETAATSLKKLGFKNFKILINNRKLFSQLNPQGFVSDEELIKAIRSLDKIKKIGEEGTLEDLIANGFSEQDAKAIMQNAKTMKQNDELLSLFELLNKRGLANSVIFSPELARGLDYYTGSIFEVEIDGYDTGSIGGGGRYDKLIGLFSNESIPAVGFSFGFDRLMEALDKLNLFPDELRTTKVLVTVFSEKLQKESISLANKLRESGINSELYLGAAKLDKQIKYADKKNIPSVIILGPEELRENKLKLKNLKNGEQKIIDFKEALDVLF